MCFLMRHIKNFSLITSSPFIVDYWGRKIVIAGGCVIMIAGAAKNLSSESSGLITLNELPLTAE